MAAAYTVTLRLGLEALVLLAILHAYFVPRYGCDVVRASRWGIAASLPVSVIAAAGLAVTSNQALWIGLVGLCTAGMTLVLTGMVARGLRTATATRACDPQSIVNGDSTPLCRPAVFVVTVMIITRAGMEAAIIFGAIIFQVRSFDLAVQACAGMLTAVTIACGWNAAARRLADTSLAAVTLLVSVLFTAQVSIYGFHELTEANVVPFSAPLHAATEPYGPEGIYGAYFPYLQVVAPIVYVMLSFALPRSCRVGSYVNVRGPATRV